MNIGLKKIYTDFLKHRCNKINKISQRKTNVQMNLIKAYFIIAVICVHTTGGAIIFPMGNWVSPFFCLMPTFVFVSGFFYKANYDDEKFMVYLKTKLKTLLVPYFLWNFFYGIVNTVFRKSGIINYGEDISFSTLFLRPWQDGQQFHFNIPSWFLLTLFIDVMVVFTLRKIFKKINLLNDWVLLILLFAVSIGSIRLAQKGYNNGFYLCITKAGFMAAYFQLGFIYKKYAHILNKHKLVSLGIMLAIIYACFVYADDNQLYVQAVFSKFEGSPILISITTALSIIIIATVCEILVPAFENSKIVNSIGDNTFSIMMHHGIVIFAINFSLYILSNIIGIESFDVESFKNTLWYTYAWRDNRIYIVYVILGVAVPLVCKSLYNRLIIYLHDRSENATDNQSNDIQPTVI